MLQSIFAFLERLIDLFCCWRIFRQLERSGIDDFPRDWTAIYRVPLGEAAALVLESEIPEWTAETARRRSTRLYIADGAPDAGFCKPAALFLFDGLAWAPDLWHVGQDQYAINGGIFPAQHSDVRAYTTVWQPASRFVSETIERVEPPEEPLVLQARTPLGGGFPPNDLPVPPAGSPKPAAPPPPAASACSPVYLFYGLCFQTENAPPDPNASPSLVLETDFLWGETKQFANEFELRGYSKWTRCAGTEAGEAPTFDALMTEFSNDLANKNFCQCVDDQLVIFIGAHGGVDPKTGLAAISFCPKKGGAGWVSWPDFLARLAQIVKAPQKTYLIVDCCRSGRIWDPGVVPASLRGMHVISGVATTGTLCAYPAFKDAILHAIAVDKAVDWSHLVKLAKWYVSNWNPQASKPGKPPYGKPKSGDLNGCEFKVEVTAAKYTGTDIGNEWVFQFECDGKTHKVAEHTLNWLATEQLTITLYDRLHGPCPTPPISIPVKLAASEVSWLDQDGSANYTVKEICDGTAKTLTVPVTVGSATKATFTLQVTTKC